MSTQNLYLLVGPSGSGKTTISNMLLNLYGLKPVVSYTTRPIRKNERDGIDHLFVSSHKFAQLQNLIAYTEFNGHQYGVTQDILNVSDIYIIDPDGVDYLLKHNEDKRSIIIIGIRINDETCAKRMRQRGDTEEMVKSRLAHDKIAFKNFEAKCHHLVNGNLSIDEVTKQIKNAIDKYEHLYKISKGEKGEEDI